MREAELSPTCEYPLSRLPPVFLNRCGWVSYRFGGVSYRIRILLYQMYPSCILMYLKCILFSF